MFFASSPVGVHFATASYDRTARLWSCDVTYPIRMFAGHSSSVDVSEPVCLSGVHSRWMCTSRLLVFANCRSVFGCCYRTVCSYCVQVVRFHGNCNYIATGSSDHTCRLWDVQSGQCVRLFSNSKVWVCQWVCQRVCQRVCQWVCQWVCQCVPVGVLAGVSVGVSAGVCQWVCQWVW